MDRPVAVQEGAAAELGAPRQVRHPDPAALHKEAAVARHAGNAAARTGCEYQHPHAQIQFPSRKTQSVLKLAGVCSVTPAT